MSPESAPWYKDAIVYQVHVKAFADGNGDGIGDFAGLIEKLPYIERLGVTAVWLLPFYPSPLRDDGYDIAEYKSVHERYGTMRDFRAFVRAAHARNIRVITELVINHTSNEHPWFQRARRAPKGSAHRNWYVWSDTDEAYAGTRIIFTDTETSNWTWDPVAGQFYWHRFFSHQPDLNFDNPRVFDAVADVMRFWFDAGVDGMRLDAVPYLVEREGTNNENLPETHAILKRLRAILDAEYPDRFLLAEANQWPEDVRDYFGDGDECHMAFHFPLMPRLFMSLAEEDRYPFYDVMRQTPPIPANAQWAIFLRNHDELTLEMVTDRERAFMYATYATEARARINVGIRRRLAPLLSNDRRQIEVMTSLLLSMPGTPIIYYGDEIGMGDNIYLGDRDGVRTPMQWSADRNGGFSRADAQKLYLPTILDPVYGFNSVNVEAQERSPSSLLDWMRRIIGIRQAHPTFGRGTLTFLYPENRRIAAYVREYEDETILCVVNLARTAQPVSLDLSRYIGSIPIEMVGWSAFAPIVDDRYVLTMPGYSFFWFLLAPAEKAPRAPQSVPAMMPEFVTLVLPHGRASLAENPARTVLERDVFPPYFAAHHVLGPGERIVEVHYCDLVPIGGDHAAPFLALVEFASDDVTGGVAFVPLAFAYDDGSERSPTIVRAALARARRSNREGLLYDARVDDRLWLGLADAIVQQQRISVGDGALVARATWSLADLTFADRTVRRPPPNRRQGAAVVGDTMQLSLFRRSERGVHPGIELAEALHEAGYGHTPPLLGTLSYDDDDGTIGIGVATRFVLNQGDGWEVTQRFLQRYIDRRRSNPVPATESAGSPSEETAPYERAARTGGERLADLHATLARVDHPDFTPTPATADDLAAWRTQLDATLDRAFAPRATDGREVAVLREGADDVRRLLHATIAASLGTPLQRIHGDFHLGRTLITDADVLIVDPGMGDAARPLHERRAKASPMRDVAGMLRSLDHAGMKALDALAMDRTEDARSFAHAIARWSRGARLSFLAGVGTPPDDPTLRLFRLWWALDDAANDATRPHVRAANLNAVLARLEPEDA